MSQSSYFHENEILVSIPQSGKIRTLQKDINYYSKSIGKNITVEAGFETDYGSIPRALQGMIPKDGPALFGYILHDYLYAKGIFSRSESDNILEEAMKALNVKWRYRKAVRFGLLIGGWVAWNECREKQEDEKLRQRV